MPAQPIIDAHVHLWNPNILRMPWLDAVPALNHPFGLADYQAETAGLDIAGFVYVEVDVAPHYALLEAERSAALAAQHSQILGIIAAAPLEFGLQTRTYLEALRQLGPRIKGVRRNLQNERDPRFCLNDDFVEGVKLLADYNWTFDLCIGHDQLPSVIELARRCPQVRFVLDHLGKPPVRLGQMEPWREHLVQLAELSNVWCKISGLMTEAAHQQWQAEELLPYITHGIATFDPQRILFGGDWPVMRLAGSYRQWVEILGPILSVMPREAQ